MSLFVYSIILYFSLFRTGLRGIFDYRLNASLGDSSIPIRQQLLSRNERRSSPTFLRFKWIGLEYDIGFQTIARKCKLLAKYLRTLSPTLIDAETKIFFAACVNRYGLFQFDDHSDLIKHLHSKLLPICGSLHLRGISFKIALNSSDYNGSAVTKFIASILHVTIPQCTFVALQLAQVPFVWDAISLPVEVISSWLNQMPDDGMTRLERKRGRYFLFFGILVKNARKMCERLKKVRLFQIQIVERFLINTFKLRKNRQ